MDDWEKNLLMVWVLVTLTLIAFRAWWMELLGVGTFAALITVVGVSGLLIATMVARNHRKD